MAIVVLSNNLYKSFVGKLCPGPICEWLSVFEGPWVFWSNCIRLHSTFRSFAE